MSRFKRSSFLTGLSGTAALTACAPSAALLSHGGNGQAALPFASRDGATTGEIQAILDYYVTQNAYEGKENVAVVAGAISPKLSKATLFFGGHPVKARHHREGLPLNGDTPFEIGSISKVFASWVFAYRGKNYGERLGDYVKVHLPEGIKNLKIENIANYSAGFPTDDEPPNWWIDLVEHGDTGPLTLRDLVRNLRGKPLPQCAPGLYYAYSNFAWGLLGLAAIGIKNENANTFARWKAAIAELAEHIGLSQNTAPASASTASVIPAGYAKGSTKLLPENTEYVANYWSTLVGNGDLVSTGNDMIVWLAYNMGIGGRDYPLLELQQSRRFEWTKQEPPTKEPPPWTCPTPVALTSPVKTSLGWFVQSALGPRILTKNGGVFGFSSWMGFTKWVGTGEPSKIGVFVLTNNFGYAPQLGSDIMKVLVS